MLVAGIASLFVTSVFAWVIGAIFGFPVFILVTLSPIFFLSGIVEAFMSSFWTLSYREFRPQMSVATQPANNPELVRLNAVLAP
jgi:type III secretory pathway component EscV